MAKDVWEECTGDNHIEEVKVIAWRVVETQEKISTRKLVDSLDEQKILDNLMNESKPNIPTSYLEFHPLIYTPFRYPPLKYGSRFGKKNEPSIWYGSTTIETAFSESAFYQLQLLRGSKADFGDVNSSFTIFSVKVKTKRGIKLHKEPFLNFKAQISSPIDYTISQLLGLKMRENNIDAFTFLSARDKNAGKNIGVYNITAFVERQPIQDSFQTWQSNTTKTGVDFVQVSTANDTALSFPLTYFLINGDLPFPAI